MEKIQKLAKNLSKNMLVYTFITILLGIFVSLHYSVKFLSKYIMLIVFMMIYPMMTNVSFESLKKIRESKKIVIIGLFFCFIIAPLLFWLLCNIFQAPLDIKTALIILAVAPASSMSLGYVGLSKGNIIAASVIVALAFILCLIIYPISIHFLSITKEVIPFVEIIRSLVFVLILPLTLGLITKK